MPLVKTSILLLLTLSFANVWAISTWSRDCKNETPEPVFGVMVGKLPSWLQGRLTRNGPGRRKFGDTEMKHMFDGLAMLHQVHIFNGSASYRSKFLKSETLKKNLAANRIVVGEFGTEAFPDPCADLFQSWSSWFTPITDEHDMTDNCGVNILQVHDELVAMTETETVRIVHPETLDTLGDGVSYKDFVAIQRATAHPHVDHDGTVYNLGSAVSTSGPMYTIVKLPNGKIQNATVVSAITARWRFNPGYQHSFAITENYFVIVETPLTMNVGRAVMFLLGQGRPSDMLVWHEGEKTRFRVINKHTGVELPTVYYAESYFAFHHVNAYEKDGALIMDVGRAEHGRLVVDSLFIENIEKTPSDQTKIISHTELTRFIIPITGVKEANVGKELVSHIEDAKLQSADVSNEIERATAVKTADGEVYMEGLRINPNFIELPRINYKYNGLWYRYVYGISKTDRSMEFSTLIKIDTVTGQEWKWSDDNYACQEPVFVPNPDGKEEDDGVVLSLLLHYDDTRKVTFLVLNAQDMTEISRVVFETEGVVTPSFHGQFVRPGDDFHFY
ncbi:unnamed protein product [Meganyctiphanes norvegica]|uniref:Uncharacterized protein n=1 Tax=Meganyctiphanes norvegica TaxID=48144 RepID=A0AAV2R382_MEGNR